MWYVLIAVGILVCAILAISSKRLLISAIWLALTSALVAVVIYMLGAPQVAVIELSVGAGLVTVLFVFAINIAGEEVIGVKSILPKWLVWTSVILAIGLTIFLVLKWVGIIPNPTNQMELQASILWDDRYLDLLLQVVLIFAGVLGVVGLLAHGKHEAQLEDKP
mgnify:FL=1